MTNIDLADFTLVGNLLVDKIVQADKNYVGLYPIPMGGFPVACLLNKILHIPIFFDLPNLENVPYAKNVLVVDDLIDSGDTLRKYEGYDTAVLFVKNNRESEVTYYGSNSYPNEWINFFWEKSDEGDDLLTRTLQFYQKGLTNKEKLATFITGELDD